MDLKYKIKRRPRRKTLSIVISSDNRIVVRANQTLPDGAIAEFVESKRAWISKTLKFNDTYLSLYIPKKFIDGENFLYLGGEFTLRIERGKSETAVLIDSMVLVMLPNFIKTPFDYIQGKLVQWYTAQSYMILKERVGVYSRILNVEARSMKIRTLKRTWANCSRLGVLTFSWRLIMAPLTIIDYVVVHELAHRIHHNHSARFWKQVEKVIPDYKVCKKWLRENGRDFHW
ncbi:MAG: M48 family metallopeptidase [Candidatus Omnitrophica bacterium]|nr:M48 family metallopeptidase [Candidatus Omnitrophota bacterium]